MSKLIKLKVLKSDKYIHIDQTNINDMRLSWKAKGIFTYLISRPDAWEIRTEDLLKKSKGKKGSLYSGIKELITTGYVHRAVKRDKKKHITDWSYYVFEIPLSLKTVVKVMAKDGYDLFD